MSDEQDCLLLQGKPLNEAFVLDAHGQVPTFFGPLGRVNIFVGANSSGKSRLMRELATREQYVFGRPDEGKRVDELLLAADKLGATQLPCLLHVRITRRGPVGSLLPDGVPQTDLNVTPPHFSTAAACIRSALLGAAQNAQHQMVLSQIDLLGRYYARGGPERHAGPDEVSRQAGFGPLPVDGTLFAGIGELLAGLVALTPRRLYVPPFRTAHTLVKEGSGRLHDDVMSLTFKHRYGGFKATSVDVFTGHDLYDRLLRHQCAQKIERERKAGFEDFLSHEMFGGKRVELVAQLGPDRERAFDAHVTFTLDGGPERPFYELGDGIAAVALLLYPIFTAQPGTWVFLEEPEAHLHPAFQRTVLEALIRNDTIRKLDLRVFMTTHSNHLLDVAMEYPDDVSVVAFERVKDQSRMRFVQGRDVRLLDALGVRNASVYLANCSIWVEGPSDVTYLRAFLAVVMAAKGCVYKEDLHYAFVEYGGSLLAHWGFGEDDEEKLLNAAVTANRICVVADRDSGKEAKHEAWETRAKNSNGALRYLLTTGREIENELSDALLQGIVMDRLKLASLPAGTTLACPETEPVGKYLGGAFVADAALHARVERWCAESGTLEPHIKKAFSEAAARKLTVVPLDRRVNLLGDRATKLAEAILSFIEKHNGVTP